MPSSTTIRRLLKEVSELSSTTPNPNPTFHAAPVSDADLHEWHFTLLGPPSPSPYAGGLYHGRISLPPQYPLKPPNFRFLTPSGRFEVNREICLSISGFHEETWMPAWGVRTALTALRSFMAEKGTAGQVGGLESSEEVRRRLARESRSWRCGECGRSNEEVMRGWWETCREKGVEVDEDGMGLEAVPEGMGMKTKGKDKETSSTEGPAGSDNITSPQSRTAQAPQTPSLLSPSSSSPITSRSQAQPQDQPVEPKASTPSPQSPTSPVHRDPQSPSTAQTNPQSQTQQSSITQSPATSPKTPQTATQIPPPTPTTAIPTATTATATTTPQPESITLDRAITAVFLALCLMILKKIFYPASTAEYAADGLHMAREY